MLFLEFAFPVEAGSGERIEEEEEFWALMDYGGGSWMMVPNESPGAQDIRSIHAQGQQVQFQDPQQQQYPRQHQSLASDFHLLHIVESLASAIEGGSRDQQVDALVNELTNRFSNCQQLLNSISGSMNTIPVTVEGQKRRLEEAEQQLNQRKALLNKYRSCVEELVRPDRQK
ncbi:mediator of RNA polymerase II transcription subunit 9-like isoform X1 [Wolffia australiana]